MKKVTKAVEAVKAFEMKVEALATKEYMVAFLELSQDTQEDLVANMNDADLNTGIKLLTGKKDAHSKAILKLFKDDLEVRTPHTPKVTKKPETVAKTKVEKAPKEEVVDILALNTIVETDEGKYKVVYVKGNRVVLVDKEMVAWTTNVTSRKGTYTFTDYKNGNYKEVGEIVTK